MSLKTPPHPKLPDPHEIRLAKILAGNPEAEASIRRLAEADKKAAADQLYRIQALLARRPV